MYKVLTITQCQPSLAGNHSNISMFKWSENCPNNLGPTSVANMAIVVVRRLLWIDPCKLLKSHIGVVCNQRSNGRDIRNCQLNNTIVNFVTVDSSGRKSISE